MASTKHVRRSVTLPTRLAEQVERIARKRRLSDNCVLVELVEQGLEAQKEKEKAFFALAERFRAAADPKKVKQLGDEMGRFVFGEFGLQSELPQRADRRPVLDFWPAARWPRSAVRQQYSGGDRRRRSRRILGRNSQKARP